MFSGASIISLHDRLNYLYKGYSKIYFCNICSKIFSCIYESFWRWNFKRNVFIYLAITSYLLLLLSFINILRINIYNFTFVVLIVGIFLTKNLKKIFLVIGITSKAPRTSVINPGMIKHIAAITKQKAPRISNIGELFRPIEFKAE